MADYPPVSVLLPTVRYVDVIDQVAAQLADGDELLVICDGEDDPIAVAAEAGELPDGVELVVAGEPERCSGKANAIAAGMEAAEHERLVWTDDDFEHPPEWLATLQADYERHGPVTEAPFFRGQDALATLLEPLYVLNGTLGASTGAMVWAGAVIFERGDLEAPDEVSEALPELEPDADGETAFLAALRRTVSDDGLLGEFVDVTPAGRVRTIDAGGSIRETAERHVRFSTIFEQHAPVLTRVLGVVSLLVAAACVLFPLPSLAVSTLLVGAAYAHFGLRRWTFLLAYPAFVATAPLGVYAAARKTFVWGGRRYRWHSKFDVEIVGEA